MQCKKCGKRLRKNEKFCTVCGYYNENADKDWDFDDNEEFDLLKQDQNEEVKDEIEEHDEKKDDKQLSKQEEKKEKPATTPKIIKSEEKFEYESEDLLEAFIGEDYKVIKKMPFNIYSFFLSWAYILYRKMYITGIIGLLLTGTVILSIPQYFLFYMIIVMLILGFVFNPLYIFISKMKIEKIKDKYEGTDKFSLLNICEELGGVNLPVALIIYGIFAVIMIFNFVTIYYNKDHNMKYWEENTQNLATCTSLVKVAYADTTDRRIPGKVQEATCEIQKANFTEYSVYIKTQYENQIIYTYYKTENAGLLYKNNTTRINALETKKANQTITDEENTELNALKQIELNYNDIVNRSNEADNLIKKKKNNSEKLDYIFTREEIIR